MRIPYFETMATRTAPARDVPLPRESTLRQVALGAIVVLAAALRFANLTALGYANHYYAAAVEGMLQSWHNFFFVAAEPGGSVSVDKPPVGLWLQTASAYVFGVNSFGLLLPQILAGIASVVLLYHLVRRSFGTVAGLLAALALAITPVVVATDRNNTIDSTLILTLLLAAWAFIVATERGKLRYLLLGATLVGIGFNIKMLEAYLPLPAFLALYLLGSAEGLPRKLAHLALASVLLLVVSLSWAVAVDLTPADQRPYVGSSGDNSVMSLAIGYNGVERLLGMGGRGGLLAGLLGGNNRAGGVPGGMQPPGQVPGAAGGFRQPGSAADGQLAQPGGGRAGGFPQPGPGAAGAFPQRAQAAPGGPGGFGGVAGGPGGGFNTGQAGPLRLFTAPLSKEASWLLPFGLFGAVLLAFRARPHWPLAPKHQAMVLWGGWLLTGGVFFSVAGFFHEYYLSMLAPPLAALVGIGVIELWGVHERRPWLAAALLLLAVGATLWLQATTAAAFTRDTWWLPLAGASLLLGVALLALAALRRQWPLAQAAFGCVITAMLITPGIWSGLTTINSSANQSLPAAYSGRSSGPANGGRTQVNQALLTYVQANTRDTKFLMAVPSSMQGADYVLATGRPVMYLGGFMGQDKVATGEDLAKLVAAGDLRYIYWTGNGRGGTNMGGQTDVSSWVTANCTPVQGFDTQTQNFGAPDGTAPGAAGGFGNGVSGPGGMQVSLYQCGTGAGR